MLHIKKLREKSAAACHGTIKNTRPCPNLLVYLLQLNSGKVQRLKSEDISVRIFVSVAPHGINGSSSVIMFDLMNHEDGNEQAQECYNSKSKAEANTDLDVAVHQ